MEGQRLHFDVIGLGIAPLDVSGILPRYPSLDEKTEFTQTSIHGGGPVPTAMVTLVRLGAKVSFVGKIGNDPNGVLVKEELEREGVNTSQLIIDPKAETSVAYIWIDGKSGKKTIALDRTSISALKPQELDREHITSGRFLHLDGRETEACLRAARWAREEGIRVVLDLGSLRPKLESILGLTDYLITSERFAQAYTGLIDPKKAAQALFQPHYQAVVITLGREGLAGLLTSYNHISTSFCGQGCRHHRSRGCLSRSLYLQSATGLEPGQGPEVLQWSSCLEVHQNWRKGGYPYQG